MPRIRNVGDLDWHLDSSDEYSNIMKSGGRSLIDDLAPSTVQWSSHLLRLELDVFPPSDPTIYGTFYLYQKAKKPSECSGFKENWRGIKLVDKSMMARTSKVAIAVADILSRDCCALLMLRPFQGCNSYMYQMAVNSLRPFSNITYPTRYMNALAKKINRAMR